MSIDYKGLISNSSYNHTLKVLGNTNSEKLTYYIDNSQKLNYIDRYLNESGEYKILENHNFLKDFLVVIPKNLFMVKLICRENSNVL